VVRNEKIDSQTTRKKSYIEFIVAHLRKKTRISRNGVKTPKKVFPQSEKIEILTAGVSIKISSRWTSERV